MKYITVTFMSFFSNLVEAVAALGNKVVESLRAQDPSEGLNLSLLLNMHVVVATAAGLTNSRQCGLGVSRSLSGIQFLFYYERWVMR
jgi:hypothetical protein